MVHSFNTQPTNFFGSHSSPADAALYKSPVIVAFWTSSDPTALSTTCSGSFPRPALCTSHRRSIYPVDAMNLNCHFSPLKNLQNLASIHNLGSFSFFDASKSFGQFNCGAQFSTHATTSLLQICLLLTVITLSVEISSLGTTLSELHGNNVEGSSSMRAVKYSPSINV
jgi:hypothetical protein